jgi:hypothetical protein
VGMRIFVQRITAVLFSYLVPFVWTKIFFRANTFGFSS